MVRTTANNAESVSESVESTHREEMLKSLGHLIREKAEDLHTSEREAVMRILSDITTPDAGATNPDAEEPVQMIREIKHYYGLADELATQEEVAVVVTTSGSEKEKQLLGLGFGSGSRVWYVPLQHLEMTSGELLCGQIPSVLIASLQISGKIITAGAAEILHFLQMLTGEEPLLKWDTQLASAIEGLDPSKNQTGDGIVHLSAETPIADAALRCQSVLQTIIRQAGRQREHSAVAQLMTGVEIPLVPVLSAIERRGYCADTDQLSTILSGVEAEMEDLRKEIVDGAGDEEFNPSSDKQVEHLLSDQLGLSLTEQTESGKWSFSDSALEALELQHPLIRPVRRFRALRRDQSRCNSLLKAASSDGIIRPIFNQCGASTGRITCSGPLQTVPKTKEIPYRNCLVARLGHSILCADYRQQELCLLATVCDDAELQGAVDSGEDLHGTIARELFGLNCSSNEVADLYPEERGRAKTIQLALIYGRSATGLANELGIAVSEAETLLERYFGRFPDVRRFIDAARERVTQQGYLCDLFGRKRFFPDAQSQDRSKSDAAKRSAQNFLVQAPAATVTKLAMLRCADRIQEAYEDSVHLLHTLHDELQFEVRNEVVNDFAGELDGLMCDLNLPQLPNSLHLRINIEVGPSWGETSAWEGGSND